MTIMTLTRSQWNCIQDICEAHKQCKRCMKLQIVVLQEEIQKLRKKEKKMFDKKKTASVKEMTEAEAE